MKNSTDDAAASANCCSGILRRLLCSGSLPTHPSDQFLDPNPNVVRYLGHQKPQDHFSKPEAKAKPAAPPSSPGVVARLMGLDSFPDSPLVPKHTTLGSLLRSRSVNSVDFLLHFNPVNKGHQHRRVRTSISFREGVNDGVYGINTVLELEKVDETAAGCEEGMVDNKKRPDVKYRKGEKEWKPRSKKSEVFQEKRVSRKPSKGAEMEEQRKRSNYVGQVTSQKKGFDDKGTRPVVKPVKDSKCVKKGKDKQGLPRKVQSVSSLKKIYPEGSVSVSRAVRSRKPLLSEDAMSWESFPVNVLDSGKGEVTEVFGRRNEKKVKAKETICHRGMVEEICRLTEEDVKENWEHGMTAMRFEEFEEICQHFGQEILQVLLKQLVAELVMLYGTREINLDRVWEWDV